MTAWRFLRDLEKRFGTKIVYRRGRTMYTTAAALAQVAPVLRDDNPAGRIRELEDEVASLQLRVTWLINRIAKIEAKM
jgi:hypothetical protein